MTEIYRAGRQLIKVRIVMLVSLPVAAAACWWGWDLFSTYGLRPADGGVLASFGTRLALGGFIALLGLAVAFGMWLYGTVYVAALDYDEGTGLFHVKTPGFFGMRAGAFSKADLRRAKYHRGDFNIPGRPAGRTPWIGLRVAGRRLPFVIDGQGQWRNLKQARSLLKLPTR